MKQALVNMEKAFGQLLDAYSMIFKKGDLTTEERNDIVCALKIAIELYERDVEEMEQSNRSRLADLFREQIEQVGKLIEKLDQRNERERE